MRKNLTQTAEPDADGRRFIEYDWYAGGIPPNIRLGENVYLDTSYGFAAFYSEMENGFDLGDASATYDRASFVVGENGAVRIGGYTILNGTTIICNESVIVGDHCMLAWGSVISDSWFGAAHAPLERRREVLRSAAAHRRRHLSPVDAPRPVVLEDNVWVGFDSIILPGVTLGRGCVIGSKTVIAENVPPYAVMVGNPARLIRFLEPDDTEEAKKAAFQKYLIRS